MRIALALSVYIIAAPAFAEDQRGAVAIFLDCINQKAPRYAGLDVTISEASEVVIAACDEERFALLEEIRQTERGEMVNLVRQRAIEKGRAAALLAVAEERLKVQ